MLQPAPTSPMGNYKVKAYHKRMSRLLLPNRSGMSPQEYYEVDPELLGSGAFGTVARCVRKSTKREHVMKTMQKDGLPDEEMLRNEIKIQSDLDHPHVCRIYDVFEDPAKIYIVLEMCKGGELSDFSLEDAVTRELDSHVVMQQVMMAVCHIHKKGICHRDIKLENFLLQHRDVPVGLNQVKMVDFGFATSFKRGERSMHTMCGTDLFMAPEVCTGEGYSEKCDIWSCGVMLYTLLCGAPPFDGDDREAILARAARGGPSFEDPSWRKVKPTAKLAICTMCMLDIDKRASAEAVLVSPWMKAGEQEMRRRHPSMFAGMTTFAEENNVVDRFRRFSQLSALARGILYQIAHNVDGAQVEQLRRTFELLDADKDGTVSVEEIVACLQTECGIDCDGLRHVFELVDSKSCGGSGGGVCYTDFIAVMMGPSECMQREACMEAFIAMDRDGSKQIGRDEIRDFLTSGAVEQGAVDEAELEEVFSKADTDGDGHVDFEEFMAMLKDGYEDASQFGIPGAVAVQ